jgi:hypothetical protein
MTISLKVTLEGVILKVGGEVADAVAAISRPTISATTRLPAFTDCCAGKCSGKSSGKCAGKNLPAMERRLMTVSTTTKLTLAAFLVPKDLRG